MTQTSTTATRIYTIPNNGLVTVIGDTTVETRPHSHAGFLVQVRRGARFDAELSSRHNFEDDAIRAYQAVIAKVEAEQAAEVEAPVAPIVTAPVVKLPTAAKGTQTRVSDPGHTVLALAANATDGTVRRGGKPGQATVKQINALASRGYLILVHDETGRYGARKYVIGGRITASGQHKLAELTAAETAAARLDAAIAGTYAYAA